MRYGLACFLGVFTLLSLAGPIDANLWWIDLRPLPVVVARVVLVLFAVAMFVPRTMRVAAAVMCVVTAINAVTYYVVLARGEIRTTLPVPLSLLIAAALAYIALTPRGRAGAPALAAFAAAAILFPLAQITFFGTTDYRRPADVIVVFGAKAHADGTPSKPLEDRIATAVELYKQGLAPRLLLSGGPGDGATDEPETMRRYALAHGVPDSAMLRDSAGLNTEATVRNTLRLAHGRILAVSNFYHLPRIKLTFQRYGSDVYTVPSHTTMYALMPYQLAREDAAFWTYYARRFSER